MKKGNKEELNIMCIAYLSAEGDLYSTQEKENKQLRYLRQYAKANHVDICLVARRNGMGQAMVDKHWKTMAELIEKGKADGIDCEYRGSIFQRCRFLLESRTGLRGRRYCSYR